MLAYTGTFHENNTLSVSISGVSPTPRIVSGSKWVLIFPGWMAMNRKECGPEVIFTTLIDLPQSSIYNENITHGRGLLGRTSVFIADSCWEARHITQGLKCLYASNSQVNSRNTSVPQDIYWYSEKNIIDQISLGNAAHWISLSETYSTH